MSTENHDPTRFGVSPDERTEVLLDDLVHELRRLNDHLDEADLEAVDDLEALL